MSDNSPMLSRPQDDAPELSGARPVHCGKPMKRATAKFRYADTGETESSPAWGCVECGQLDVEMTPRRSGQVRLDNLSFED